MRISVRILLALAALPLVAAPARAQEGITPYVSLATGLSFIPRAFASCGSGDTSPAGEVRAGVRAGRLALEARGAALNLFGGDCLVIDTSPLPPPPDGIHPEREYDFSRDGAHGTLDLRLRYGGTRGFPLVLAVGGGRMVDTNVGFVLASVGFRTPGRVRLALDAEADWFRVGYEDRQVEYRDGSFAGVVSRERHTTWWRGTGVRVGVEIESR